MIKTTELMIPEIGCNVSNFSQLAPVKTRIPLKTHIIKQCAAAYIQQKPNRSMSQTVCITLTNAKGSSPTGDARYTSGDARVAFHCLKVRKQHRRRHNETDEQIHHAGVKSQPRQPRKTGCSCMYNPPSKPPDQRSQLHERFGGAEWRRRGNND